MSKVAGIDHHEFDTTYQILAIKIVATEKLLVVLSTSVSSPGKHSEQSKRLTEYSSYQAWKILVLKFLYVFSLKLPIFF